MFLYRLLLWLIFPFLGTYVSYRLWRGKEERARLNERHGIAAYPRPKGSLIWLHGASVGEVLAMLPCLEYLKKEWPKITLLVTSGTVTSANLAAQRLPKGVIHQYVPIDHGPYVDRFIEHWKPDLALWFESEFWPHLLFRAHQWGAKIILINGRMSDRSFTLWRKFFPRLIDQVLRSFSLCLVQTSQDAQKLKALGAPKVQVIGNIKFAATPLPYDQKVLQKIKQEIGARPQWCAAQTHQGEEEIIAQMHQALKKTIPTLLTIIAPRHPARYAEILKTLRPLGVKIAVRSKGDKITPTTDIYLADTMGELGIFYRLCPVVLLCFSLLPGGKGHNYIEPALLGRALLSGPYAKDQPLLFQKLKEQKAVLIGQDGAELRDHLLKLLKEPKYCKIYQDRALNFAQHETAVMERLINQLKPYLKKL